MFTRTRLFALRNFVTCGADQKGKTRDPTSPLAAHFDLWYFSFLCWFKRKEADLVYAQLAEFDNETDATKTPKSPSYEPTVYADVEVPPPELPAREDPDSSQPTYANLDTTGVWMKPMYVIYQPGGPYWEKLWPSSSTPQEAVPKILREEP